MNTRTITHAQQKQELFDVMNSHGFVLNKRACYHYLSNHTDLIELKFNDVCNSNWFRIKADNFCRLPWIQILDRLY